MLLWSWFRRLEIMKKEEVSTALELEEAADDPAPVNPFTLTSGGRKLQLSRNEDSTKEQAVAN